MTYRNKPLVVSRPWWRHPIFPWGWYSTVRDNVDRPGEHEVDGYLRPGDSGRGIFVCNPTSEDGSEGEKK